VRRLLLVVVVACGGSSSSEDAPLPPPVPGRLVGGIENTDKAMLVRYLGVQVPIEKIPAVADAIGLPVTGLAEIKIDITIPRSNDELDMARAAGAIDIQCAKCTIGDDNAKLVPKAPRDTRAADFVGDGIAFGHITVERLDLRVVIARGRAEFARFVLDSPDIAIHITGGVDLARAITDSRIDACVRFQPKPELRKRDPRTHDVLMLTGAQLADDGFSEIGVRGSIGDRKMFAGCKAR
jgi:type II secretion system protein N